MAVLFDWDEGNIAHIAEHGVSPIETEDVVTNSPLDIGYESRNGELRLRQAAETSAGRILAVISTVRSGRTRVITAYPASRLLRATYLRCKELAKHGKANSP
jgi:uncharacterized DUF497 family protein